MAVSLVGIRTHLDVVHFLVFWLVFDFLPS